MNKEVFFFRKKIGLFFLSLFFINLLSAEDIRGLLTQDIKIKNDANYVKQVSLSAGEMIGISLDKDPEFLTGVQIEITISETLKQYSESFIIQIFNNVLPLPDVNTIAYTGSNIFYQAMPWLNSVNIRLPLNSMDNKRQSPGNYSLAKVLKVDQFPLLFTIQVISKGIPDSVLLKSFYLKIRPEIAKKGYLALKLLKPEFINNDAVEMYIDDTVIPGVKFPLLLDTGMHTIKIIAANCLEENSSFMVESGKTTNLEISLKESVSRLILDILPGTQVFLDGNKVDSIPKNGITVTPGNHTLRFKTGDYSVSKSIYITEGKRYNVSLFLSVDVKEN